MWLILCLILHALDSSPYFAYLSVLHLRETFGERELGEKMRTHYAGEIKKSPLMILTYISELLCANSHFHFKLHLLIDRDIL